MLTQEEKALGRGSVSSRLWPGGVLVYDIEPSIGNSPSLLYLMSLRLSPPFYKSISLLTMVIPYHS